MVCLGGHYIHYPILHISKLITYLLPDGAFARSKVGFGEVQDESGRVEDVARGVEAITVNFVDAIPGVQVCEGCNRWG